jgi:hypothetical protein
VALLVDDIDAALPDFLGRFGLHIASDETLTEPSVRLVHLDAGNVDIQLVQPTGPGKLRDDLDRAGPGLHHVCFGVATLSAALASVGESVDAMFRGGQGRPACFLTHRPSQLYIELIEFADGDAYGTLSTSTARLLDYWADECRRDLDRMMTHFSPDAEVVTPDGAFRGYEAIAAMYQKSYDTYPDLTVDVIGCFAGRGSHGFEYDATLTDTDGADWTVQGVNVMTLDNGLISRLRSYEDAPRRRVTGGGSR